MCSWWSLFKVGPKANKEDRDVYGSPNGHIPIIGVIHKGPNNQNKVMSYFETKLSHDHRRTMWCMRA